MWVFVSRRRRVGVPSDIEKNLPCDCHRSRKEHTMKRARHFSVTPGTAIALVALFFALGGSAFAVGERIQSPSVAQQRCTNGAVRGIAAVTGDPSQGMANIPDQFSSANNLFSRKFNCTGKAVQVRRADSRRVRVAVRRQRRARVPWRTVSALFSRIGGVDRRRRRSAFGFRTSGGRDDGRRRVHRRGRVATESAATRTRRCLPRGAGARPRSRERAT